MKALASAAEIDSRVVGGAAERGGDTVSVGVVSVSVGEVTDDMSVEESHRYSCGWCVGVVVVVAALSAVDVGVDGVGGFACAAQSAGLCLGLRGLVVFVVDVVEVAGVSTEVGAGVTAAS